MEKRRGKSRKMQQSAQNQESSDGLISLCDSICDHNIMSHESSPVNLTLTPER